MDEILAGILRKFMVSDRYVEWADSTEDPAWMVIDATVELTIEEVAALNEAMSELNAG